MNFTNVVGILKGERFGNISDRILGVAAHFDTVDTTPGNYIIDSCHVIIIKQSFRCCLH